MGVIISFILGVCLCVQSIRYIRLRESIKDAFCSRGVGFASQGWKEDLNYLDTLVEWPQELAHQLEETDKLSGKSGSGWAFDRCRRINESLKYQKKPISTHFIKNHISDLTSFMADIRRTVK